MNTPTKTKKKSVENECANECRACNTVEAPALVETDEETDEKKDKKGPKNALYKWAFTLHITFANTSSADCAKILEPQNVLKLTKELWDALKECCKKFNFQLERGEKTGLYHFQGVLSLYVKERLSTLKNILGYNHIHLERCRNWNKCINYTSKDNTKIGKTYNENSNWIDIPHLRYKWQIELKKRLLNTSPDKRAVIWYCDTKGNTGKTDFAKHMLLTQNDGDVCYFTGGKNGDISFMLPDAPKIVIIDLPRTAEGKISYNAIEQIKNGMVQSSKYKSRMKIFNIPHLLVFANWKPEINALSHDRWDIIEDFDMNEQLTIEEVIG